MLTWHGGDRVILRRAAASPRPHPSTAPPEHFIEGARLSDSEDGAHTGNEGRLLTGSPLDAGLSDEPAASLARTASREPPGVPGGISGRQTESIRARRIPTENARFGDGTRPQTHGELRPSTPRAHLDEQQVPSRSGRCREVRRPPMVVMTAPQSVRCCRTSSLTRRLMSSPETGWMP